jgi:uncharacterized membrane protein YiaA
MGTSTQIEPTDERIEQVDPVAEPDGRNETQMERLDRNSIELMSQLRVAGTGIQVLLAFLLIVPFNARWSQVSAFDRDVYFVTLLCIAAATVLLIAPTVHHRMLFQRGEKDYLVSLGNRLAIIAMGLLTIGLTGILLLISDVLFGGVAAGLVGVAALIGVAGLWFGLPLRRTAQR